jgi:hypothetical protein
MIATNAFLLHFLASVVSQKFFSVRPEPVEGHVPLAPALRRAQREPKNRSFFWEMTLATGC